MANLVSDFALLLHLPLPILDKVASDADTRRMFFNLVDGKPAPDAPQVLRDALADVRRRQQERQRQRIRALA